MSSPGCLRVLRTELSIGRNDAAAPSGRLTPWCIALLVSPHCSSCEVDGLRCVFHLFLNLLELQTFFCIFSRRHVLLELFSFIIRRSPAGPSATVLASFLLAR